MRVVIADLRKEFQIQVNIFCVNHGGTFRSMYGAFVKFVMIQISDEHCLEMWDLLLFLKK